MAINLREVRKNAGITQEELASRIGATKRQVGAWERGENDIPMDYAVSIADALGCSVDEIAGRSKVIPVLTLDWDERALIALFRLLRTRERELLMDVARAFAKLPADSDE